MRIALVPVLLAALVSCGTERSKPGFATSPGTTGSSRTALTLRVVDDPSGAVDVTSASSRPFVSLVFDVTGEGETTFRFTGAGQIQMSVPIDSSQTMTTLVVDGIPAARFESVLLHLENAQLPIPGDRVSSRDMLRGSTPTLLRPISLDMRSGGRTLVIDLNSAQWLRAVANPLPGEAAYAFDGATAFLNAVSMRTP
jgi:hypothetical protein